MIENELWNSSKSRLMVRIVDRFMEEQYFSYVN